jgi:hypothetical protein
MTPANNSELPSKRPERAGWRSKPAASPGAPRPTGRRVAGWAERKSVDFERAAMRHRFKIATWSLLFLALIVGFLVWLFWTPVRTPILVAVVTD